MCENYPMNSNKSKTIGYTHLQCVLECVSEKIQVSKKNIIERTKILVSKKC